MANSLSLVFDVLAIDRASEVFRRVGDSAGEAGAKVEASTTGISNAGSKIAAGLGVAAAAAAVVSVKMAADFQASTTRLVTSANETQGNLDKVRSGLLDMAGQVGYSVDELSTAMYKVESGGQHGAAGLEVLKAAAQGAKTENADLTTVADAVTSAMQDYHLKASDAADVTSKLVAATASGKMTFEELAGSMAAILPTASANHVALNDILGDLASMTVHGMSAEQAAQNMADAIRHLAAPTQVSQKELALIGMTAQQVSADLSSKGLSGTVQELSKSVLDHLGPDKQKVVLDLMTAMQGLSPQVRDLAQQLVDGSISAGEYTKAAKGLAPELQGQAAQFATLAKSTHGIGNEQISGAQVMQSYSGAMKALMGDATGMNVALMLTGDNSKTTATAIANVSKASADARGNVAGWDLIQGNFNQKLDEAKGHLQAMAIEAGTKLLPALSGVLDFVNSTVLPGIHNLGSGIGSAVKGFQELPGPLKTAMELLGGIALANAIGLWSKLGDQVVYARVLMSEFATSVGGSMGRVSASYAEAAAAARLSASIQGESMASTKIAGAMAGTTAAAKTLATNGFGAIKSGASGLMSMFGGPWGLALAGAGVAIGAVTSKFQQADQSTKDWTTALEQGGAAARQATDAMNRQDAELAKNDQGFMGFINKIDGYSFAQRKAAGSTDDAKRAAQDHYNSLGLVDQKTIDVANATDHLSQVLKTHGSNTLAAKEAENQLQVAQQDLKVASDELNQSTKTAVQLTQEQAQAALNLAGSGLNAKQSYDEFAGSLAQYQKDVASGTVSAADLTREQDALNSSTIGVMQSAGQAGEAWAKANGVTDTATASQYGQLLALEKVQKAMGTDTPAAVVNLIGSLQDAVSHGNLTQKQMDAITAAVDGIPGQKKIDVTADTQAAEDALNAMLKDYQNISYTGSAILVNGKVVANADGNLLPMSATEATVVQPGTLRVIGDNPISDEAFIPINNSPRSLSILGETAARMGLGLHAMASGGFVTSTDRFWAKPSPGMLDSVKALASMFAPAYNPSAGAGGAAQWTNVVLQALAMEGQPSSLLGSVLRRMNQESGGNPFAVNRSDINWLRGTPSVGAMQVIGPTYAKYKDPRHDVGPYAYGVSEDMLSNLLASMNYGKSRYGSLSAAYDRVGGYETGTNYVPTDQLAYLHKGEAVVPASKNQGAPYQSGPAVFHLYDSDGTLMGTMRGQAEAVIGGALTGMATTARAGVRS